MSAVPGGDLVPGPHPVCCEDWGQSRQVSAGKGMADPSGPPRGMVVRGTMLLL